MCKIDVDTEDFDAVPDEHLTNAPLCTGVCKVYKLAQLKIEDNPDMQGILPFSKENDLDFTAGMDGSSMLPLTDVHPMLPMDPLFGQDEDRVRREFLYLFENANVLESMLVSINHLTLSNFKFKFCTTISRRIKFCTIF